MEDLTVTDALGQEVRAGDVIAYGSLLGRSAALKFGRVEAIKPRPSGGTHRIVVRGARREQVWDVEQRRYIAAYAWRFDGKGNLDASLRRFIKLGPEQAALVPEVSV